jgi:DNA-binding CsgD family transcriptional regulator
MGRRAELGRVERLSAWAEEDVAADLVSAIVAGTGEVELQHRDDLFGSVKTWLTVACSGWQIDLGQLLEWSAPAWTARRGSRDQTQELLQSCASLIGTQVDNAKSYAREHVMAGVFSEGFTGDAEKRKTISKKLKHKELDFSCWLDGSGLTPKQRECAELKFEYGLTVTEIGVHLRKSRKTIQEHLARADAKIAQSKNREVRARRRAKVKPGEIDSF